MSTQEKIYRPIGIQTLVPYLSLKNVPAFVDFAKDQMDANIVEETKSDDGVTYYSTVRFDDTTIFVNEASEEQPPTQGSLYLYVPDTDAFYAKLVKAGVTSLSESETFYHGDRFAYVKDMWDYIWYIATANEELTQEEVQSRRKDDER